MKLRALKVRSDEIDERNAHRTLRVVEGATQIIEWPYPATDLRPGTGVAVGEAVADGGFVVKAEIQTKRFRDRSVDADRYAATIRATDASPYAILTALVEACRDVEAFHIAGETADQIIMQISLRG